jgi:phage repressor protein C with HTH and peptisase S24 domain
MGWHPNLDLSHGQWESSHCQVADPQGTLGGMTYLAKQIERRMLALGHNAKSLSKKAGLNDTAIRDILEGRSRNPRHDTLQKIAKILGCVVADLTGERAAPAQKRQMTGDTVEIAELEVHAGSGMGIDGDGTLMANDEGVAVVGVHTMPTASFREAYGISSSRIKILAVKGDSMAPKLWPGQRVMVDIEDRTPSPPGIFVVWDGLALVLKYVEVVPNSDPLRVRISSANSAFQAYERNIGEAYINGRVIGVWARI